MKKMKDMNENEKMAVQEARDDWNNQCKRFMQSKIPFRDRTMEECLERHMEYFDTFTQRTKEKLK